MLRTKDPTERALLRAVRDEAFKVVTDLQKNLARYIVNEQAEAQKRGKNKGK